MRPDLLLPLPARSLTSVAEMTPNTSEGKVQGAPSSPHQTWTIDKPPNFSVPQFPHLLKGDNMSKNFIGFLEGLTT